MVKHILHMYGVQKLTKRQQAGLRGGIQAEGEVDKCCIRVPSLSDTEEGWCNDNPKCSASSCAC